MCLSPTSNLIKLSLLSAPVEHLVLVRVCQESSSHTALQNKIALAFLGSNLAVCAESSWLCVLDSGLTPTSEGLQWAEGIGAGQIPGCCEPSHDLLHVP